MVSDVRAALPNLCHVSAVSMSVPEPRRGHSRDCRDFSSTQVALWKYSILYTIPDVWHSYIDIFSCISVFTHLLSCRKDQPRQRCTDCLKTKRRNASAFLEQLRWSNQAPAGKCKTLRRNRRNPIQVSLYFKSNIFKSYHLSSF